MKQASEPCQHVDPSMHSDMVKDSSRLVLSTFRLIVYKPGEFLDKTR